MHPQNFDVVKIWAKSLKIWGESADIQAQAVKTHSKLYENTGKNGAQNYTKTFFGGHPNNSLHEKTFEQQVAQKFLGLVWENSGKNPSHPQKFDCSYTCGFDIV